MTNVFRVRILDVGQGDAIVSILPSGRRAIVVDAYNADRVLDFLESEGIQEVIVFLTHSDTDHTKGAEDLLAGLEAKTCPAHLIAVFCSQDRLKATDAYKALLQLIGNATRTLRQNKTTNPSGDFTTDLNVKPGFSDLFESVTATVVHPEHADRLNLTGFQNEISGVLKFGFESCSVLLTGDVQLTGISLMMSRDRSLMNADVLKYPHHGAWPTAYHGLSKIQPTLQKATMSEFLEAVMPLAIVFSVGRDNKEDHIRSDVIEAVDDLYRSHGRPQCVRWTQATPTCLDPSRMPPDGPLYNLVESGDVEFVFDSYGFHVVNSPGCISHSPPNSTGTEQLVI